MPGIRIEVYIADTILYSTEITMSHFMAAEETISTIEYEKILNYLNTKSIGYFIKLDKKIEDLKKHNTELDKKKLKLEEELKKII